MRDIKEIEGKTIDKVSFSSDHFALLCTNGDVYAIKADEREYPFPGLIQVEDVLRQLTDGVKVELGILTEEQVAQNLENYRKEKAGRIRQDDWEPMGFPRVFSGEYSKPMWEEINQLSALSTGDEIRDALYFVCCRIQELEAKLSKEQFENEERVEQTSV